MSSNPIQVSMPLKVKYRQLQMSKNQQKFYQLIEYKNSLLKKLQQKSSKIFYLMFQDFKERLEEKFDETVKHIKNQNYKLILFFIVYKLNNIKNFDQELKTQFSPLEEYTSYYLPKQEDIGGYFSQLEDIADQLQFGELKVKKMLLYFEGISIFPKKFYLQLIKVIEEIFLSLSPQLRIFFLFQTIEGNELELEKESTLVEYIHFQFSDYYIYKVLWNFIKTVQLPETVVTPRFLCKIISDAVNSIEPLEAQTLKLFKLKEVHFLENYEEIFQEILSLKQTNFQEYNDKFKFGLKGLKSLCKSFLKLKTKACINCRKCNKCFECLKLYKILVEGFAMQKDSLLVYFDEHAG